MHPVQDFAPALGHDVAATAAAVAGTALAYTCAHRIFRRGPLATAVASVLVSWVPVQSLALVLEGRRMWLPGQHSAVFFWGDLVALPAVTVAHSLVRRLWAAENPGSVPPGEDRRWLASVMAAALLVSYAYHSGEIDRWDWADLHAPSKAWHDFFVYPVFLYLLASPLPTLLLGPWRRRPLRLAALALVMAAGVGAWFWLGHVYDPAHALDRRPLLGFA